MDALTTLCKRTELEISRIKSSMEWTAKDITRSVEGMNNSLAQGYDVRSRISELQNLISKMNELQTELATKQEFQTMLEPVIVENSDQQLANF